MRQKKRCAMEPGRGRGGGRKGEEGKEKMGKAELGVVYVA